jgi:hypothetical protein
MITSDEEYNKCETCRFGRGLLWSVGLTVFSIGIIIFIVAVSNL